MYERGNTLMLLFLNKDKTTGHAPHQVVHLIYLSLAQEVRWKR